jgi:hypothetical protein
MHTAPMPSTCHISPLCATARELAVRRTDGIHVTLLWHPETDEVAVRVDDRKLGVQFEVPVAAQAALHAFEHPFTYVEAA